MQKFGTEGFGRTSDLRKTHEQLLGANEKPKILPHFDQGFCKRGQRDARRRPVSQTQWARCRLGTSYCTAYEAFGGRIGARDLLLLLLADVSKLGFR